jgi:TetR/AcrR family transcriptional regulator, repressor for uid operon
MAVSPLDPPLTVDGTGTRPDLTRAPDRTADETARRLVAAAAEVFAEKGYDGAGVAEIARRAGLTTGAIYSRFAGKAELLAAAVEISVPEQFESLFAESLQAGRATDILQTVGDRLVTRRPVGKTDLLLEAVVAARRDPELATVVRAALAARKARWAELIEASKARGDLAEHVDTDALVHFAHAVGLGFLAYEAVGIENPAPGPWQTLIATLVDSLTPTVDAAAPLRGEPTPPGAHHGQ